MRWWSWNPKTRLALVCAIVASVFSIYSIRLIDIQIARHDEYTALAAQKNTIRQTIYARRGVIADRNGEMLASNMPIRTVFADGSHIKDPAALAELAAPFLEMDAGELAEKLKTDRKYLIIRRGVPEEKALGLEYAMRDKNIRGLYFEQDSVRVYPNGPALCHVLGFLNHERTGIQGVELSLQDYLQGENGYRHIERDRTGRELVVYRGQEHPPRHGYNVRLTIDMGLQMIVEQELDNAVAELKPETAVVVLVNPKTGEILAMSSRPHFDPNKVSEAKPEQMKNRAILDMVEPGSTFKIVVTAGGLNEKTISTSTQIFCEHGRFAYGGRILRDHHGYGMMDVHGILVKSSNIGSAKIALMMGDQKFYEYVRRFGFGERTGVELPGEIAGLVHPPHRWDKLTITRMPMGHAMAATPLQIVMALSAVANGGKLMAPHIAKGVYDEQGNAIATFPPVEVREVMKPEVAKIVSDALHEVVSERGTARLASVTGYNVAGKTGTAQKVSPHGGYLDGKYVVSFAGYLPAEDPQLAAIVIIDDAKISRGLNYGGLVAAPIFSRIAERAVRYLDIPPSPPVATDTANSSLALQAAQPD